MVYYAALVLALFTFLICPCSNNKVFDEVTIKEVEKSKGF